ncbi:unnamed protein product [Protopolystoma xenopodis]|uniref:Uncharacterized protein n=1 Tax=Protopolystoma xenopodis TaxID=117903 RepID=A0A3S5FFY0_9PLAT|nr:unnamed protein product [Protopolystoma xenopodis]
MFMGTRDNVAEWFACQTTILHCHGSTPAGGVDKTIFFKKDVDGLANLLHPRTSPYEEALLSAAFHLIHFPVCITSSAISDLTVAILKEVNAELKEDANICSKVALLVELTGRAKNSLLILSASRISSSRYKISSRAVSAPSSERLVLTESTPQPTNNFVPYSPMRLII